MHGSGGKTGLLKELAPAAIRYGLARIDEPGRQFPSKLLERRPILPHDRNFSVRRTRDDGDVILLADRVI